VTEYILDTDHITALQRRDPIFLQYFKLIDDSQIFVTIINLEEQVQGRFQYINEIKKKKDYEKLLGAYANLRETVYFFSQMQENLLDFDQSALDEYQKLCQKFPDKRIQQDLKIAAIALTHQMILVTRNTKDFCQIPDLTLEDWTK
jgi:tRNA(fMet)-specific endonuclease VapC